MGRQKGVTNRSKVKAEGEEGPPQASRAARGERQGAGCKKRLCSVRLAPVGDGSEFGEEWVDIDSPAPVCLSHGDIAALLEGVLSPEACGAVVRCAEAHGDWKEQADSVDGKAEWQHTIVDFSRRFSTQSLGNLCSVLADRVVLPALQAAFGLDPSALYMHWAFVRAYAPSRRLQFPVHRDSSVATANILLSPPGSFQGADLYVLGPSFGSVDKLPERDFRKLLPEETLRRNHSVDYGQGDCVMHLGKRMHGVLPIISGTRHTLILMFYERK